MPLEILHQDDHLVAINKPAGLLVHSSRIAADVFENAVKSLTRQLGRRVLPIHRLDRPTSGVLLFAFDSEMARQLTDAFMGRQVEKQYLAIVRGYTPESGVIEKPLDDTYRREANSSTNEDDDDEDDTPVPTAECRTEFVTLSTAEIPISAGKYPSSRYSLVRAVPMTGRTHQIRRHFKHIRHPIAGDGRYGDHLHNRMFREHLEIQRMLLVARELSFVHPATGERLTLQAGLGEEFERALEVLGLRAVREVASGQ